MAAILSENLSSLGIDELTKRATPAGILSKGDAAAQFELGVRYGSGNGVKRNEKKANEWYCKAAKQGLARAQNRRGEYFDKVSVSFSSLDKSTTSFYEKKAFKWFARAAKQGDVDAQFNLALLYQQGRGVPQNYSLAIEWCEKAAVGGHDAAKSALRVLSALMVGKFLDLDTEILRRYAKGSNPAIQYELGLRYDQEKNMSAAEPFYKSAAEQGHVEAQNKLAECYYKYSDRNRNKEAFELFQKSAEQGSANAKYNLALLYQHGKAVSQDFNLAIGWHQKAIAQGHEQACVELSKLLKVLQWKRKAELGDAASQYKLGWLYDIGIIIAGRHNGVDAEAWYRKAAEQGFVDAQYALGEALFYLGTAVLRHAKKPDDDIFASEEIYLPYGYSNVDKKNIQERKIEGEFWLRKAAKQDYVLALLLLSYHTKDKKESEDCLVKAMELGNSDAKKKLAELYFNRGKQLDEPDIFDDLLSDKRDATQTYDKKQAMEWYRKAKELGYTSFIPKILRQLLAVPSTSNSPSVPVLDIPSSPLFPRQISLRLPKLETPKLSLPTVPRISWKELTIGDVVGNGSYGDVYKGQWHGAPVAIKILQLKTLSQPVAKEFEHESDMMMKCQFPSIVKLYGICTEPGHLAMVMEYMPISLRSRLQDSKVALSWSQRLNLALDMAKGLAYLHNQGILHRDLKSLNILLDEHGRAKIADFGLAKVKLEIGSTSTKSHKMVGSVRWRAPELFKRHAIPTPASDIYSLGMLFWELASRQLPYSDASDEQTAISWIKDGEQEKIPEDCPKVFAEIIQACWAAPEKRPTAAEVITRLEPLVKEAEQAVKEETKLAAEERLTILADRFELGITRLDVSSSITFTPLRDATSSASPSVATDKKEQKISERRVVFD